jgi:dolichol-phosphate mannosyltransferase
MPGVWLILPTYDEAENIEAIVGAALPRLAETGLEHRVLVVDDGSPDGTGEIADRLAAADPRVEVLHRASKDGIGPAYLAGFGRALAGGADYVMEMDSDFSHDPADIPRLVAAAARGTTDADAATGGTSAAGAAGADLVLGSRYVPGGGVTDWGLLRRAISRGGSLYARLILGIPVHDLTGGFKCFRRAVLEQLDLTGIGADGYGFQIEMTYRTLRAGFAVEEVPILFRDRRVGSSKMSAKIAVEAFWKVPLLRLKTRSGR